MELWPIQSQNVKMHKMWKPVQGTLHGKYVEICFERIQWWLGKGHSEQRDNRQA